MSRGDDPVGLFLDAVIEDADFREAISSGDEQTIRDALADKGIELPRTSKDQVVDACLTITSHNGWNALDQLRKALLEQDIGTLN
jgi:hypothetical protein